MMRVEVAYRSLHLHLLISLLEREAIDDYFYSDEGDAVTLEYIILQGSILLCS